MSEVGDAIRALRQGRKLTQQEIADRLKVHVTHYSKLETGAQRPGYELIEHLAAVLHLDPLAARGLHILAGHLPAGFVDLMRTDSVFSTMVWALWAKEGT